MTEPLSETISLKIGFKLLGRTDAVAKTIGRDRSSFIREAIEEKLNAMDYPEYETPPIFDPYYGQYREFHIGGRRVAVAITPWRNDPCIVFHVLGNRPRSFGTTDFESNKEHLAISAYTMLHETEKYYHWETDGFRRFCQTVGLDSDAIKPQFSHDYDVIARKLLDRSCRYDEFSGNLMFYRNYIQDVLDILRNDNDLATTREAVLNRCCRDFVDWEDQPEATEIKALLIALGGDV